MTGQVPSLRCTLASRRVKECGHEASVRRDRLARGEVDVASQGESEGEALAYLKGALELHFEPPQAARPPMVRTIEVEFGRLKPQPFREIKRRLEGAGFVDTAIVPRKPEVPAGTIRSILSQAHIRPDDWDKLG
jgi:predicted RNase H-like HicB family nuclease